MSVDAPTDWDEALDLLEARVVAYRLTLDGASPPPPFLLPQGLGPMPQALAPRAHRILAAQLEVESAIAQRLGRLASLRYVTGVLSAHEPAAFINQHAAEATKVLARTLHLSPGGDETGPTGPFGFAHQAWPCRCDPVDLRRLRGTTPG